MQKPCVAALLLLAVFGCSASQESASPELPSEAYQLSAALDPLGATVVSDASELRAHGWADLSWVARRVIEDAHVARHFEVRGDEVNVLIYGTGLKAQSASRSVEASLGAAPLAAPPGDAADLFVPAAYFVAGRMVVRHRGTDPDVGARLVAALGEPDYVSVPTATSYRTPVRSGCSGGPSAGPKYGSGSLPPSVACYRPPVIIPRSLSGGPACYSTRSSTDSH